MSTFKNASKSNPCPICGKQDWCTIRYTDSSETLYYCRRISHGYDIISSLDSRSYIFIGESKDNASIYEEEEMRVSAKEKWLIENGKKIHPSVKRRNPIALPSSSEPLISIPPLGNIQLNKIYRSFLDKLNLQHNHVCYLKKEGWHPEIIMQASIKSMPMNTYRERIAAELVKQYGSLAGVPGFYINQKNHWTLAGTSGILFPICDYNHNIYRLKIRSDHPVLDENGKEKDKYKSLSSFYEVNFDGTTANAYLDGCQAGNHVGIYHNTKKDDYYVCYITEGEKKAIYSNYMLHSPVISIPGVNSFRKILEKWDDGFNVLDFLKARGCKVLIIAYDADKKTNESVLMYEQRLIEFLQEKYDFSLCIASWNLGFGKGIDDILANGILPNYEPLQDIFTNKASG